jgi:hypothetical protein
MKNPIQIKVRLQKDDYVKALSAFGTRQFGNQIFLAFIVFVVISGVIGLFRNGIELFTLLIIILALFAGVYPTFIGPILIGNKIEKNKDAPAEVTWDFSDNEIAVKSDSSELKLDWNMFNEFLESKHSFLLVHSENKRMFQIIPKRVFNSSDLEDNFRLLLKSKFGTGPKPFIFRHWKIILFVTIIVVINIFAYILGQDH